MSATLFLEIVFVQTVQLECIRNADSNLELDHQIGKLGPVNKDNGGRESSSIVLRIRCESRGSDEHTLLRAFTLQSSGKLLDLRPPHVTSPALGLNVNRV